ncbi:hypothetical protein V6N13_076537 [Hibiscus sabdariffa]
MRQRLTMPLGRKEMSMRVEMIETISLIVQVWVHLRNVPVELFTKRGLSYITSAIGTPLYMDGITAARQRLAYAKVCVELSVEVVVPRFITVVLCNRTKVSVGVEVPWMPVRCGKCAVFGHSEKHYKADVPLQVVCDQGVVASSVAVEIPLPVSVLGKVKVASTDNRVGLPAIVQGQTLDDCKVGSSVEPLVATVVEVAVTPFPSVLRDGQRVIRGSSNKFACLAVMEVRTVPGDKGGDAPDVSSEAVDLVDLGHGPGELGSPMKTRAASKGVPLLVQGLKAKKNIQVEQGNKQGLSANAPPPSE